MGAARASKAGSFVVLVAAAALVLPTVQSVGWSAPPPSNAACTVVGTNGPDTLTGTSGSDVICGRDGDDTITALGGDDLVRAGGGNDDVNGGAGTDRLVGGAGDDTLNGSDDGDRLLGEGGVDILIGAEGDDDLFGGTGNDDVRGGAGADRVAGSADDDTVNGGADNDEITGDGGVDWLLGSTGNDRLHAGPGDDLLNGGDDNDDVRGGLGNDTLIGAAGDDLLQDRDGSPYVDTANCGDGADRANVDFFDTVDASCEIRRNLDREDPVAVDDAASVVEDDPATAVAVLANDTDADGGPMKIDSVTQPANGTVVITGSGSGLTYEPSSTYCNNGTPTDDFTYTLAPGGDSATVAMTVTCVDPAAVDDDVTATEDGGAQVVNLLGNDTLAGGAVDTFTQPGNGTVAYDGTDFTYEPAGNYCNNPPGTTTDDFTYTLTPGGSTATVHVTVDCVDDDPDAVDDVKTVTEDDAATTIDVLANDTDVDGGPITIASATDPALGTVAVAGDGSDLTYTPDANACNNPPGTTDDFDYTLTQGGDTATVKVTIDCVTDPAVPADDVTTVAEDDAAAAIDVLANDTPGDGTTTITGTTDPTNGAVVITGGGTGLTYEPDDNYCNNPPGNTLDTFDYTVDPGGDTATVTVTVTCVNDAPVADDESYSGANAAVGNTVLVHNDATDAAPAEAGPHKSISGDLLDGDTDVDGPGPLTLTAETVASADGGSVVIQADGDFVYTPKAATSCTDTTDSFAYNLNDGDGGGDIGVVTIAIAGCVWYVDNTATAGGTGVSNAAFDTLTEAEGASGANHTIFVFDGDGLSTGYGGDGLLLKSGQRLIGEHTGLQVGADTLHPANPGARPTLTATNADVVSLDDDNVLRGLVIDPSGTGGGIAGGSGDNNGTIAEVNINDGGAAGNQPGLELDATSGTFAVSDLTVSTTGATGIRLANAGTVGFADTGTISVTSSGAKALDLAGTNLGTSVFDSVTVTSSGSGGVSAVSTTGTATFSNLALTTTSGSTAAFFLNAAAGVTVPSGGTATISATGGPAVDVVSAASAVLGFDSVSSTNSAFDGISLDGLGTGTFSSPAGSITNASGITFDLNSGSGDVSYGGGLNDGGGTTMVEVTSRSGGTTTLSGAIFDSADAGGGISLSSNTGGTTIFSGLSKTLNTGASNAVSMTTSNGHTLRFTEGNLSLTTAAGRGFNADDSGTVTVTGSANTISSAGGRALSVASTDIGADGLEFRTVSATGGSNGIVLDATGSAGRLVVTGNGGTCVFGNTGGCSGGTISGFTGGDDSGTLPGGTGIVLRNTTAPSFTRIRINGNGGSENYGIRGTSVAGFTLVDSVIDGAIGDSALTANKDGGLRFEELTGTVTATNVAVSGGYFTNVMVDNTAGTLNATFNNVDSLALDATGGDDAVQFEGIGTADMNVVYTNSQVTTASGDMFQYIGDGTGGGDLDLTNNSFINNEPSINTGGGGLALVAGAKGAATMDVVNNTMQNSLTNALTVIKSRDVAGGTNNLVATIDNNFIGLAGTANSGSAEGDGMEISTWGDGNATFNVTNNVIRQYNSSAIQFLGGGGVAESGQFNLNISGNSASTPGTNPNITLLQGIRVDSGVADGDNFATCVDFGPNSITGSSDALNKDFRLFAFESGIRQPGYAGGATDGTAFKNYAASLIGNGADGTAAALAPHTFTGAGSACP